MNFTRKRLQEAPRPGQGELTGNTRPGNANSAAASSTPVANGQDFAVTNVGGHLTMPDGLKPLDNNHELVYNSAQKGNFCCLVTTLKRNSSALLLTIFVAFSDA